MVLTKNGTICNLTNEIHISAYLNSGWKVVDDMALSEYNAKIVREDSIKKQLDTTSGNNDEVLDADMEVYDSTSHIQELKDVSEKISDADKLRGSKGSKKGNGTKG